MRGALDDAQGRCAALLEKAPEHLEALNLSALIAFRQRRHVAALATLERAQRLAPTDAQTLTSLGHVREAAGDVKGALGAFDQLLSYRPQDFAARLHRGRLLEQLGQRDQALFAYARAIGDAKRLGRWTSDDTTAPAIREQVRHAIRTVNRGVAAYYERAIAPLKLRFGADELRRVEHCLAVHLGQQPLEYADPRQQPTFLYFPSLPATPYLDMQAAPWREALEAQTDLIEAELRTLLPTAQGREAVFHSRDLAVENLRGTDRPPDWNGYYFFRHGEVRSANHTACPRTAAALAALPLARIPGHAPEVLFSVFSPGTHLLPHRGVTNTRVVGHLPLIVPPDCALRVGGETHAWLRGEAVVFDDSYEHEAWNRSTETRVVLIFDLWHPELSEAERLALSALVVAMGDYRLATEPSESPVT